MITSRCVRVLFPVFALVLAGVSCSSDDRRVRATASGERQLSVEETIDVAYRAGFRTESQLVAIVSIAVSESSLRVTARKWHPEYGYRRATDAIGVAGPSDVWNSTHTQQLNSDRGIWQISSHFWPQYTDARADDPAQAAVVAWEISKQGRDFRPWDTFKAGAAQRHAASAFDGWPAIRPIVQKFLAKQ